MAQRQAARHADERQTQLGAFHLPMFSYFGSSMTEGCLASTRTPAAPPTAYRTGSHKLEAHYSTYQETPPLEMGDELCPINGLVHARRYRS